MAGGGVQGGPGPGPPTSPWENITGPEQMDSRLGASKLPPQAGCPVCWAGTQHSPWEKQGAGALRPGSRLLPSLLPVWPRASHFTSLSPHFYTCQMSGRRPSGRRRSSFWLKGCLLEEVLLGSSVRILLEQQLSVSKGRWAFVSFISQQPFRQIRSASTMCWHRATFKAGTVPGI